MSPRYAYPVANRFTLRAVVRLEDGRTVDVHPVTQMVRWMLAWVTAGLTAPGVLAWLGRNAPPGTPAGEMCAAMAIGPERDALAFNARPDGAEQPARENPRATTAPTVETRAKIVVREVFMSSSCGPDFTSRPSRLPRPPACRGARLSVDAEEAPASEKILDHHGARDRDHQRDHQ